MLPNGLITFILLFSPVAWAADVDIVVNPWKSVKISEIPYGIMHEDIDFSGDGGIYAELIRNRAFQGSDLFPPDLVGWTPHGSVQLSLQSLDTPLSSALPKSMNVKLAHKEDKEAGFTNSGWWGFHVAKQQKYTGSFWVCGSYEGDFTVALRQLATYKSFAKTHIKSKARKGKWVKHEFEMVPMEDAKDTNNYFSLTFNPKGVEGYSLDFNLISLFPPTFKGRKNGLRKDLAEAFAALKPKFLRFPGGNALEGPNLQYPWKWDETIGELHERPGRPGTWGYQTSDGMGLVEYFEWCEDMDMEPILAIYSGLAMDGHYVNPTELKPWVQSALNELEFILGDKSTFWGSKRAARGHPEPWSLRYVEIGNEDWLAGGSPGYSSYKNYRFKAFKSAISKQYPHLQIISSPSVYEEMSDKGVDGKGQSGQSIQSNDGNDGDEEKGGSNDNAQTGDQSDGQGDGQSNGNDDGDGNGSGHESFSESDSTAGYSGDEGNLRPRDVDITKHKLTGDWHPYRDPDTWAEGFHQFDDLQKDSLTLIGEFASVTPNGPDKVWDARYAEFPWWGGSVGEAIFMLSTERNGDRILGTTYAPILRNIMDWQYPVCMVEFDADPGHTTLSTSYHVFKLISTNEITHTLATEPAQGSEPDGEDGKKGSLFWVAGRNDKDNSLLVKLANYNMTDEPKKKSVSIKFDCEQKLLIATTETGRGNAKSKSVPMAGDKEEQAVKDFMSKMTKTPVEGSLRGNRERTEGGPPEGNLKVATLTMLTGNDGARGANDPRVGNEVVKTTRKVLHADEDGKFNFEMPELSVAVLALGKPEEIRITKGGRVGVGSKKEDKNTRGRRSWMERRRDYGLKKERRDDGDAEQDDTGNDDAGNDDGDNTSDSGDGGDGSGGGDGGDGGDETEVTVDVEVEVEVEADNGSKVIVSTGGSDVST